MPGKLRHGAKSWAIRGSVFGMAESDHNNFRTARNEPGLLGDLQGKGLEGKVLFQTKEQGKAQHYWSM